MVDFRYHLVSIIAVFLALAVGIVLGSTVVERGLVTALENRVDAVTSDRDALRVDKDELTADLSDQTKFGKAVLPYAVGGRLMGQRIIVVSTPGSPSAARDAAAEAYTAAGATIAGRIEVTDKFIDPAQGDLLDGVARLAAGAGSAGEGTSLQRAANQLAIALAAPSPITDPNAIANPETQRVLTAFEQAGVVSVDGDTPVRSPIVVVVARGPEDETEPAREDHVRAVNEVIAAFARQAPVVVTITASDGAAEGGVLASLRSDQNLADRVATVDHADTPAGQTAVVFAILERLKAAADPDGDPPSAGHYGDGPGADKPLPDPDDLS